ncbi:Longin-like domain-containing protein [Paraphysoderma sedebokerense]|nr:Longin-like domain-containing protein [Paraphysoderma sedebokerense]
MVQSTIIARVQDGLPLAASMDDDRSSGDLTEYKNQAKLIFKKLTPQSEPRMSIESGQFTLHYLVENGVCYLTIAQNSYPRKLAFDFLNELAKEFYATYAHELHAPGLRPYAFVKFDTVIQKTKKNFQDTRAQQNVQRLNEDLQDVARIMTKNMEDLLLRGDTLDKMSMMSDNLRDSTLKFRKESRQLNIQALYRKYGPPVIIFLVVAFVLYLRWYWF